jgi:tetratricopeptide (TPR) repeat protein
MSKDPHRLFETARAMHQAGQLEAAAQHYAELLALEPDYPHAGYLCAVALLSLNRANEALPRIQAHLKKRMDHAPGWITLGGCYARQNKTSEAAGAYQEALRLEPKNFDAALGLGQLLITEERWEALNQFTDPILKLNPSSLPALGLKVRALTGLEDYKAGLAACVDFLARNEFSEECYKWAQQCFNLVPHPSDSLLEQMKAPEHIECWILHYHACLKAKRIEAALETLNRIREADPDYKHLSRELIADSLQNAEFYTEAEPHHWELLAQNPHDDQRLIRLIKNTLELAKCAHPEKYADARELGQVLLARCGDTIECCAVMNDIYMHASRPELALPYQERILAEHPGHPLACPYLFVLNYDERRPADEIFQAHRDWARRCQAQFDASHRFEDRDRDPARKLRIGYLSPDLGRHPVGFFSIDIFKEHDPNAVEVFLYSNRHQEVGDDPLSQQFRAQVGEDHWRWTRGLATEKLRDLIRDDAIDILIEMAGHTAHNRLDALASRSAPIQVSWLGYPNTTGLETVDYRLSDAITEPEGAADTRSTETIYRMPNGFHMFNLHPELPQAAEPPCLQRGYVTFGSYNNMNKLGSKSIELWAKLLKRVPNSRIILKHKTLAFLDNRETIRSLFAMHGIQAHRVILRTTTPGAVEHYQSYGEMDIALDPLAYNGTTTSCDALAMGVPILTLPGQTHASRVTASLLHRVGLERWAASSEENFLQIGSLAAQNPEMLRQLRQELPQRFRQSPLGDGPGMARDLEDAYRQMWQTFCNQADTAPAACATETLN